MIAVGVNRIENLLNTKTIPNNTFGTIQRLT
jgi:hypothetical protein